MKFFKSTTKEVLAHARAIQKYPFGLTNKSFELTTHQNNFANPNPVVLIHGVVHNRSAFFPLQSQMQHWSWRNIVLMNYKTRHGSLMAMVEDLSNVVEEVLALTQASRVDVVGHSLGGLVARYYMTHNLGRNKVRKLVTLGTVHNGVNYRSHWLKLLMKGTLDKDLRRESFFIKGLKQGKIHPESEICSVYSSSDLVAGGHSHCSIIGPGSQYKNFEVEAAGHLSLLYDDEVFKIIRKTLGQRAFN